MEVEGEFFKPGSSQGEPARLSTQGESLTLISADSSRLIDLDTLVISQRLAQVPRNLTFPDGGMFTTLQNEQLDRALLSSGIEPKSSWIVFFESGWRWTLLALVAIPVLLFMLFTFGMPLIAGPIASWVPETLKQELDAGTIELFDELVFKPSSLTIEREKALEDRFRQVSRFLPNQQTHLQFRDGGAIGANAFALPGGTIVLTDQLVKLAENDGELVAIFAHELGHVAYNHSLRNLVQSAGVTFVVGWMLGDLTLITDVVLVGAPVLLQKMSYSRGFEREADQFSMMILDASGYSRSCFADIIERLNAQRSPELDSETSYVSSHPAPGQRVAIARTAQACSDQPSGVADRNKTSKRKEPINHPQLVDKVEVSPPYLAPTPEEIELDLSEGDYRSVSKVAPTYPFAALARELEGYCVVEYTVTIEGKVANPVVLEDQCTSPYFREPSLDAARKFRYKPKVENGEVQAVAGVQNRFTYKIVNPGETPVDPPYRKPE